MNNIVNSYDLISNIEEILIVLKEYKTIYPENIYRIRAYNNLLEQIKLNEKNGFVDINHLNITKKMRNNLDVIINNFNKKIQEYSKKSKKKSINKKLEIIKSFTEIHGVGKISASLLYDMGFRKISEIGKSKYVDPKIQICAKYFYELKKKIKRSVAEEFNKQIKIGELSGSYRRCKKLLGDLDIIIKINEKRSSKKFNDQIKKIKDNVNKNINKYILMILSDGDNKSSYLINYENNIFLMDLFYCTQEEYPFIILQTTGSRDFNINMRKIAISNGYSLGSNGLFKITEHTIKIPFTLKKTNIKNIKSINDIDKEDLIKFNKQDIKFIKIKNKDEILILIKTKIKNLNSEKDIFKKLKMDYVDPCLRK